MVFAMCVGFKPRLSTKYNLRHKSGSEVYRARKLL